MIRQGHRRRMKFMAFRLLFATLLAVSTANSQQIDWQPWSGNVFRKATAERTQILP